MTDRKNGGFTLVELMVVILIGSIITLSATTVLLFSLRIYLQSNEIQKQQNNTRILMTALEDMAAEGMVDEEKTEAVGNKIVDSNDNSLMEYVPEENAVKAGGTAVLTDVTGFEVKSGESTEDGLITVTITFKNEKSYTSTVFCRAGTTVTAPTAASGESTPKSGGADAASYSFSIEGAKSVASLPQITETLSQSKTGEARSAFLDTLLAQTDSGGTIQGTGEYFSQWYITAKEGGESWGGDWNGGTPWCACFISWALSGTPGVTAPAERVNGDGVAYWYANVDEFMEYFDPNNEGSTEDVSWYWNTQLVPHSPAPGDLIFFDWTADTESNPEHMGVVLYTDNGGTAFDTSDDTVYTIEGNTYGTTAIRSYALTDPRILGYGTLNWTPNA